MSVAMEVSGLGKRYRIGAAERTYDTLGGAAAAWLRAPVENYRRLRDLTRFADGDSKDVIWALRDVSFTVETGEVLGVIGRNGAGKSTLLKVLSRIAEPTSGHADIYGRVSSLLEVGTGFHPELTGRENLYLNGTILGMTKQEVDRKFDEIVGFAGVEPFIDTPVKRFSSGMKVRLGFSIAAHLDPEIMLIDEVLAVGDAEFQKKCLGKLGEVARGGRTVVFVSHDMNAIERLCTRALWMDGGHCQLDSDDVRGVITRYLRGGGEDEVAEWRNGGGEYDNRWFVPHRLAITDAAGRPVPMPKRNDEAAWVEIEGEVRDPDPALTIGYAIYAGGGELLYWSYQTDVAEAQWPRLEPGRCVLRAPLPTHLLNEDDYRIELMGSLHFREWLFRGGVDAPGVHLQVRGGLSDSPYWQRKRPGLLAPVIPWIVEAKAPISMER
jgi:lipopolysaccharide transport system ATP-binding protein